MKPLLVLDVVGLTPTLLGGKTLINNQPLAARHELKDGDILNVSGLTLEFRWRDVMVAESAA